MIKKKTVFEGAGTAIVTPFKDGGIDYASFGRLIDNQLDSNIDGIIVLGTTGEASTISESERYEIIDFAKRRINGKTPLIVGTGTNNTAVTLRYSKSAYSQGADALLIVTPYYNKATENGLVAHYREIARNVDIPIILYNVPSRTGVNMSIGVYEKLSKIENIVAIKEASGSLPYAMEILNTCGDFFDVYSGNDDIILPLLSVGAKGVISVVSNITPSLVASLCKEFFKGNTEEAKKLQLFLTPLIKEMFKEVNPIPIKTALSIMGKCSDEFRLPLCKSTRTEKIKSILSSYSLI